jgi:hypothetical protein
MKRKFDVGSLITAIIIVGVLVSFIPEIPFGEIFGGLGGSDLETLLETINPVLAFAALAGIFIFLIARAARGDKEYYWDFDEEKKDEGE